jgi:cytochrome c oxidase subunit 2
MMPIPRLNIVLGVLALTVGLLLSACGSNGSGSDSVELSPEAEAGRSISNSNGCAACHGTNGQGGVGPPFKGIYGSTIELDDGSTVIADEAFLIESIKDPEAKQNAGYSLPMPTNQLTDDEIDQIVTYIRELATPDEADTP